MQKIIAIMQKKKKYILPMLILAITIVVVTAAPAHAIPFIDDAFDMVTGWITSAACTLTTLGTDTWNAAIKLVLGILTANPTDSSSNMNEAWVWINGLVTFMVAFGSALTIVYFLASLSKDALEYGQNFDIHHVVKRMAILALTMGLVANFATWVPTVFGASIGLTERVMTTGTKTNEPHSGGNTAPPATFIDSLELSGIEIVSKEEWDEMFPGVAANGKEQTNPANGNLVYCSGESNLGDAIISLLFGLVAMAVISSAGILLIFDVVTRWFKIFMILPLAPVALAGYSSPPGSAARSTANAWVKNFLGYTFEIVLMVIAIGIGAKIGPSLFNMNVADGSNMANYLSFKILSLGLIALATRAMVKGAEGTLHQSMGL